MGIWTNSPAEALEPFITSLRSTMFHGDLCIFVEDLGADVVSKLISQGVLVQRLDQVMAPLLHVQTRRYFAYQDYLARVGDAYDNVLLSDLRDVIFQSDPFDKALPADIVFAQERCLLGESPVNSNWVAMIYGPVVADSLRDYAVSCSGTTFGSVAGMRRYLAMMTNELASLPRTDHLKSRGIDQGIHNYLIRMRPLRGAWSDPGDSLVATLHYVPDTALRVTERGVLVDGRLVPVIHQWDRNETALAYVRDAPVFRAGHAPLVRAMIRPPAPAAIAAATAGADAVLAFYDHRRDAEWLTPFLASLRVVGHRGGVHCIGVFGQGDLQSLARYGAVAHPIEPPGPQLDPQNIAHLFISRVLDRLAADEVENTDQVLILDCVRACFLRDPFQAKTVGLSVFQEGTARLVECADNLDRLQHFAPPDPGLVNYPVVSSSILRGRTGHLQLFYRRLLTEFVGRAQLLGRPKVIQGAVNKLCRNGSLDMPVTFHPNGAEAYFDVGPSVLPIETQLGLRVGGGAPFAIVNPAQQTELTLAARDRLGIG